MLREVALRRALEAARDRRRRELEEVAARSAEARSRLRELTTTLAAIESVRARFGVGAGPSAAGPPEPGAEGPEAGPEEPPKPTIIFTPLPKEEDVHAPLLRLLTETHPEGFTVGEMRNAITETSGKATYDAAWALANALTRKGILELAGTRPGPAGPIRIFRVAREQPVEAV